LYVNAFVEHAGRATAGAVRLNDPHLLPEEQRAVRAHL